MKLCYLGSLAVLLACVAAGCRDRAGEAETTPAAPVQAEGAGSSPTELSRVSACEEGERGPVATTALPVFSATISKRDVISEEPILLKLEVTNPRNEEVLIVAPYFDSYACANYPLTLSVTDASAHGLQNGWEFADSGYEPIHRGRPWWIPDGRVQPGDVEPRAWRAWRIPAGATAYMWYNMLQFYPIDDPGQYHIVLRYDSKPEMLFEPGQKKDNPPKDVLCWSTEIEAGWVTVMEPGPKDAAAAANLRKDPEMQGVMFATNFVFGSDPRDLGKKDTDRPLFEGTTYEPYARFARAFYSDASPSPDDAAGLPLADLLKTVAPRRAALHASNHTGPYDLLKRLEADPGANAAQLEQIRAEMHEGYAEALAVEQRAVEGSLLVGDYSLAGYDQRRRLITERPARAQFPDWPN